MDASRIIASERVDESTPTPVRQSEAAALRKKHVSSERPTSQPEAHAAAASDAVSVMSKAIVLKGEPNIQIPSIADSDSDSEDLSSYGLQRALNAPLRIPQLHKLTKQDVKNNKYLTDCSDEHDKFLEELNDAKTAFKATYTKRDRHNDGADPVKAAKLDKEFLEASNRFIKSRLDYHTYAAEINELREKPQMTRSEAKIWSEAKLQEKKDRDPKAEENKLRETVQHLENKAKDDEKTIVDLKEQLEKQDLNLNSMRTIVAQRRSNTDLRGQNADIQWETRQLTTQVKVLTSSIEFLRRQVESLESRGGFFKPAWEDFNSEGVTDAMAARRVAQSIAFEMDYADGCKVAAAPMKDTFGEILGIHHQLVKHGVIFGDLENAAPVDGKSQIDDPGKFPSAQGTNSQCTSEQQQAKA